MSLLETIFSKSLQNQTKFISKLQKEKIFLKPNEYINFIHLHDPELILSLLDHLQYIKVLNPILTKKTIQDIFNQLIIDYDYELSNYRILQSSDFITYFISIDNLEGLQKLLRQLIYNYIKIMYQDSLLPNDTTNNFIIKRTSQKNIYPKFYTDAKLFRFFKREFINFITENIYYVLQMTSKEDMLHILSSLYYLQQPHFFINQSLLKKEMINIYDLFLKDVDLMKAEKASLYFKLLSNIFNQYDLLYDSLLKQSEKWLQESSLITFISSLCKDQTIQYIVNFIQSIGSNMRCLLLQFVTLYIEEGYLHKNENINNKQEKTLFDNIHNLRFFLTKDNDDIIQLCPKYFSPTLKVFKILDKKNFKSNRIISNNQVESRIGCDQHQFSRQGLLEWQKYKDNCPEIINNTSSFWCENCYLDYKQDCNVKSCNIYETLEENKSRLELMEKCIYKRNLYTHYCSWSTDDGHEKQINEKKTGIDNCNYIINKLNKKK